VKTLADYLDTAMKFERMAADEKDSKLKADFERQAAAYRKLAQNRAKKVGVKMLPREGGEDWVL
jgi:hypothetical protein